MISSKQEKKAYNFKMTSIYNFDTQKEEPADYFLKQDEETVFKLRYSLKLKKKRYGCPVCKTSVILKRSKKGNFFFSHLPLEDGKRCFLVEQNSGKRTIQEYNYRKESDRHIYLKNLIGKLLKKSIEINSNTVKIEKRLSNKAISAEWKLPDVQCEMKNGKTLAVEIQLCQTWLADIVKRESFYQKIGVSILWVFNDFDIDENHITKKDIFYNNPSLNVFVFDKEVQKLSIHNKQLFLKCYYPGGKIDTNLFGIGKRKWIFKIIQLKDLKFDKETLKPYYFKEGTINKKLNILKTAKQLSNEKIVKHDKKELQKNNKRFEEKPLEVESDIDILNYLFKDKISRSESNLKSGLNDLKNIGISLTLMDLVDKNMIHQLNINTYQKHYERKC